MYIYARKSLLIISKFNISRNYLKKYYLKRTQNLITVPDKTVTWKNNELS